MIHEVKIKKVNQGFIISIGCQTFVSTDEKKMFEQISEYFEYPDEAEKKYVEKNLKPSCPVSDITVSTPRTGIVADQFQGNRHYMPTSGGI